MRPQQPKLGEHARALVTVGAEKQVAFRLRAFTPGVPVALQRLAFEANHLGIHNDQELSLTASFALNLFDRGHDVSPSQQQGLLQYESTSLQSR
jgi:hypothetical protein